MPGKRKSTPGRVKEPVQLYLDRRDKSLLEDLAERTGLSQAEVLRRGLRRVGAELLSESAAGSSIEILIGVLAGVPDVPADLAASHDDYLYAPV